MPTRPRTVPNAVSFMLWVAEYEVKPGTLTFTLPEALALLACASASRPTTQFLICQLKPNWPPPVTEFALALPKLVGHAPPAAHGPRRASVSLSAGVPERLTPSIPSQPTLPPI